MTVKAKRLVNDYEEGMLEFIKSCIGENYQVHTQVGLSQICPSVSNLEWKLRQFLRNGSTVDALITNSDYMPCLVMEFQSRYHDQPEAEERDRMKAALLSLAGVPLIYSRVRSCRLLHLFSKNEEVVFNLYTGQERENAEVFVRKYCEQSAYPELQIVAI